MTKEIVAFDVETTGLSPENNDIIQIGLVKFDSTSFELLDERLYYILPEGNFVIEQEAEDIHGITKEYLLEHGTSFASVWSEIEQFIGDCDLLSYNGNNFDVPFLCNTLRKNNLSFNFTKHRFYDALTIERERHSNRLADVYKRYTGKELVGAHNALADVKATAEVFALQMADTNFAPINDEEFEMLSPENFVKRDNNGDIVFAKGKYANVSTNKVCANDPAYIRWVIEKFSSTTKDTIKNAWLKSKQS